MNRPAGPSPPFAAGPPSPRLLQALEREIAELVSANWSVGARPWHDFHWHTPMWTEASTGPDREALERVVAELKRRHGTAALGALASGLYFFPTMWQTKYAWTDPHRSLIALVLRTCVVELAPPESYALLHSRLAYIFGDAGRYPEVKHDFGHDYREELYFPPSVRDLLDLLAILPPTLESTSTAIQALQASGDFSHAPSPGSNVSTCPFEVYSRAAQPRGVMLLYWLLSLNALRFEQFLAIADHNPYLLSPPDRIPEFRNPAGAPDESALRARHRAFANEYAKRLCANFSHVTFPNVLFVKDLKGPEFLIAAGHIHATQGLGLLNPKGDYDETHLQRGIIHLLQASGTEPSDPTARRNVVEQLRRFPDHTLKHLLPHAPNSRHVLLEALGWTAMLPIVDALFDNATRDSWDYEGLERASPFGNTDDPRFGVFDVPSILAAMTAAGPDRVDDLLHLCSSERTALAQPVKWIELIMGKGREDNQKRLAKRQQAAVRGFGLFPLERGQNEAIERYLWIKQFARDAKKFGPQRQATETATAEAALENLARVAGFEDRLRLEWAMEAQIGSRGASAVETWIVGDVVLRLLADADGVRLVTARGDKELASVPKAVKDAPEYAQAKEATETLRGQVQRMRATLELMMTEEAPLTQGDLQSLMALRSGRLLLGGLIVRTPQAEFGIVDPSSKQWVDLEGRGSPLPESVCVAHPYHLWKAGRLAEWQQAVVHRRLVQPFKQAFRELYLITPAERDARFESRRFHGNVVVPQIAVRLFQARGWVCNEGIGWNDKRFQRAGLFATFSFPDSPRPLSPGDIATSDVIGFRPIRSAEGQDRVSLESVPPTIFSEVMRDADLVVSVAQQGSDQARAYDVNQMRQNVERHRISDERVAKRAELMRALVGELGLEGVQLEGHFALVAGKLANYRVHLDSASIHIDPGAYVCIVPHRWGHSHPDLFLPFAQEEDEKASEVISKILLLLRDDQIKDPGIRAQIEQAVARVRGAAA